MTRVRKTSVRVVSAVVAFATTPLWAAESAEKAKAGLPQLDMSFYPGQLFWLAVSFAALYLLMTFVALPAVQKTQDSRKHTIAKELASARIAHDQATQVMAQVEQALAESRAKARAIVDAIKLDVTSKATEHTDSQHRELVRQLRDSEARIVTMRIAAIRDVEAVASDLAASIVERVSGLKPVMSMREGRP
jgi:F-type H+-transporting ATPase subunit b